MKAILIDLDGTKTTIEVPENAPNKWMVSAPYNHNTTKLTAEAARTYKLEWIYPASTEEKKWAVYKEMVEEVAKKSNYTEVAKVYFDKMTPSIIDQIKESNSFYQNMKQYYTPESFVSVPNPSEPMVTSEKVDPPKLPPIAEKNRRRMKLKKLT